MQKKIQIQAQSEYLADLRSKLQGLMKTSGLDEKVIGEMSLAIDEAITNIIRHGYKNIPDGVIDLEYTDFPDRVEIVIEDHGKLFNPLTIPTPELPPTKPGGLGVHFIRTLMDDVIYQIGTDKTNQLKLIKNK
jgi:serine/threonine-protein kinase RsbW